MNRDAISVTVQPGGTLANLQLRAKNGTLNPGLYTILDDGAKLVLCDLNNNVIDLPVAPKKPLRAYFIGGPALGASLYNTTDLCRTINASGVLQEQIGNPIIAANGTGGANYQSDGLYRITATHPLNPFTIANQFVGSPFLTDTVMASNDASLTRKLKAMVDQYGILADIASRKPALVVLQDIGWHSVTDSPNELRTWRSTVLSIINAATAVGAHVLIFPDTWNPSASGSLAAFNPSSTFNPDKKEAIKRNNKWLQDLSVDYANVWFFNLHNYAYNPTSATEFTPKTAALSKSYIYGEKSFTWHLANACKSALGSILTQIAGILGGVSRPFDPNDRTLTIFRDIVGSSGNWPTNYGASLSDAGNGPLHVFTALVAAVSAIRFTGGTQSVRRQMASGGITNFSFIGTRISFRLSAWVVPYDIVLNIGPYALRFSTAANTIQLYTLASWPSSATFSASNLGTLLSTWSHTFDASGNGEAFTIRIKSDTSTLNDTSALISIYSHRQSQVVVEDFSGLNFSDYATSSAHTFLGFGDIASGATFIGDVVVTGDKTSGAIDRFDHTLAAASFASVTTPGNGWSGTFPPDLVQSAAFLPMSDTNGGQNATTVSSRVTGADGAYRWQWVCTLSAIGGAIVKFPLGALLIPGRFYQVVWPYKITGVTGSPVAPGCGLMINGPNSSWRTLYAVGIDQDAVGNNSPIFDVGGITDDMDAELVARSAIYKVTPGNDYGDVMVYMYVSSKAAATFTLQCNLPQVHDVTDLILATRLY